MSRFYVKLVKDKDDDWRFDVVGWIAFIGFLIVALKIAGPYLPWK